MTMSTVLVVAAHPDDEILGCGATMARHAAEGDKVHVLLVGEGATSRQPGADAAERSAAGAGIVSAAAGAAQAAAQAVGAQPPIFLGMPDNQLDGVVLLDLVQAVEQVVEDIRPDIVYTHHGCDLNVDHRLTYQAVLTACRPLPDAQISAIYSFEVLSSTEWSDQQSGAGFRPNHFVDVGAWMERKFAALGHYAMEMRDFPHPRSIDAVRALAQYRGATVGCSSAEAFQVVRQVKL